MYKFRSMTDERDEKGELLPDEVRLTSFGKKLRATSLDELPELFNILNGGYERGRAEAIAGRVSSSVQPKGRDTDMT